MKTFLPPVQRHARGMTLTELLFVIAAMVVLMALTIPAMRGMYEDSKRAACVNNLRNIGVIFHQYAAERNGVVRFLRDGSGSVMWYNELKRTAGLTEEGAQKAFSCPKTPWRDAGSWWCYGMRLGYLTESISKDPGYPVERSEDGKTATYGFRLSKVAEPSAFFLMSDSATAAGKQSFRIADRKLYSGGVILRHREQANVLFLDGHVESLHGGGLKRLNFQQVLDSANRPLSL